MMRATSESDVTSIAPSSSSPAVYYVQSPSQNSQDEADKCSSSNCRSPLESPSFPRTSLGSLSSTAASRISGNRRRWNKHYCDVVNEEKGYCDDDYYYEDDTVNVYYSQCRFLVLVFGLVFAGFCLVIWVASRPYKAQVNVKSLRVNYLYIGEGSDRTGVPTKFLTVNCSTSMVIHNPARFFGIHVSSDPVNLIYSELTVATGQLNKYYQPRKSRRFMSVSLVGEGVPLYGTGMALSSSDERGGIPFRLEFEIQSKGHLVGKLVKTKHTRHITCSLIISSKNTKEITFEKNSCKYV
ncbi:hypothetical protein ACJIZ3_021182 [Penstemon smallii]|uniref:Late embryogenesis abundant protein LEA-2 subgroup domain-containing protein n=1 Tax=Penstemon smallii TaxID=265156 RepID=A0ABD3SLD8_9LAMI